MTTSGVTAENVLQRVSIVYGTHMRIFFSFFGNKVDENKIKIVCGIITFTANIIMKYFSWSLVLFLFNYILVLHYITHYIDYNPAMTCGEPCDISLLSKKNGRAGI